MLGSGALSIGQAGEFDFSGSQALKALKEEGIKTVLVNPNIATVQTSEGFADEIYFVPITPEFVEKVIEKEKPAGILLSFGGQTALNCGIELYKKGILKKYNVRVLGTSIETIIDTEDRELFKKKLEEIDVNTPKSIACENFSDAKKALREIGFPVMIRAAFALGGLGSGIACNEKEFSEIVEKAFANSKQVLIEEYLHGWKEIEYEVVRDREDNCITVCNMENFDPLGIHTGESIVVAPSQTLSNEEYHNLREISIKVIKHLGIIGECNIQFALDPFSEKYKVIEVNARLSRSSALASKATGYPLAFIATKLALGKTLIELKNSVTKDTSAFFEPALDYCVVKIPRWDLEKFRQVSRRIGSEMKSVGEVMAIGRTFEEALQKAIRMLDIGMNGLTQHGLVFEDLKKELKEPTDKRIFAIEQALRNEMKVEKIYELSSVDKWFLHKLKNIVEIEKKLEKKKFEEITQKEMRKAKENGFSDKQLAKIFGVEEENVWKKREEMKIKPVIKQIDTLAAEYPAKTNYLYLTFNGTKNDVEKFSENTQKKKVIVLGSGPYRIGSSVEFDWCAVNCVQALAKEGFETIMINYNPETVSTDYDICDKLYFEELGFEKVREIYDKEKPEGIILSMGGQIPNNLAMKCKTFGLEVLGTSPENIDNAESRHKFSALCDKLGIDQPEWKDATTKEQALSFAEKVGYPVIVRPSYVLSGSAMSVALNERELEEYLNKAIKISGDKPVTLSKFIIGAKEIEIDAVAKKGKIVCWAITEHVENAGIHSGDATIVLPAQKLYLETVRRVKEIARKLANALEISGPFNIQFIAKDNQVKVIECNLRASRSFPFVSKVSGNNFIRIATKAILGKEIREKINSPLELDFVGVKAPQFSYSRLRKADPILSVEMNSTGEVACFGKSVEEAFLKSILSTGFKIPEKNVLLSIGGDERRFELLQEIKSLKENGFMLYATEHTAEFLKLQGIENVMLNKISAKEKPNIVDYLAQQKLDLVICISRKLTKKELDDAYEIRRRAVDYGVPLITNTKLAKLFINSVIKEKKGELEIEAMPWSYYLKQIK